MFEKLLKIVLQQLPCFILEFLLMIVKNGKIPKEYSSDDSFEISNAPTTVSHWSRYSRLITITTHIRN